MEYRDFYRKIGFFKKLKLFIGYKLKFWYLARSFEEVPFFRQIDPTGKMFTLPTGTKCYLMTHNVFLELRGDRWYALGESESAKKLNREVEECIKAAADFDAEAFFAQAKKEFNEQSGSLIDQEFQRAGITKEALELLDQSTKK